MNHNYRPPSESDDNDNDAVSTSPRSYSVKPSSFDFLLNQQKEQHEAEAAKQTEVLDDDDESESRPGKRRSKAAKMLRGIFKRNRATAPSSTETVTEAVEVPERAATPVAETVPLQTSASPEVTAMPVAERVAEEQPVKAPEVSPATPLAAVVAEASQRIASARAAIVRENAPPVPSDAPDVAPQAPLEIPTVAPTAVNAPPPPTSVGNRAPASVADYLPPAAAVAAANPANRVPPVIHARGGVAGPLTAFLAADYLSRRRRKKSHEENKKLRAAIKDSQIKQQSERQRLNSIETSIRNRAEQPRPQPETPKPAPRAEAVVAPRVENRPEAAPVVPLSSPEKPVVPPAAIKPASQERPRVVEPVPSRAPEKLAPAPVTAEKSKIDPQRYETAARRTAELSELRQKHAERLERAEMQKQAEAQAAVESKPEESPPNTPEAPKAVSENLQETRHEVKDDSTARGTAIRGPRTTDPVRPPTPVSGHPQAPTSSVPTTPRTATEPPNPELYKQSIRAGILVGAVVIVLGIIAAYLLK